ncbi:hypothetical protein AUEXF2481DRAFT_29216 [Aureobasidium subglaciale EXF-2481]|uniref:Altered inheritance of mitochondria protein 6 n=1 Tax=Aureobasidium subglaciale (strain EXF-2481) TaxID=1043005 RepID=A0A074YP01_AURSE|nr:uncharacterized protein AUEXF2481DRAFT_29216 [Aureobasidium subglaciale EXF-2481]KAI5201772.1 hypothetical protein E4T38_05914 [Aureobasidium subglaciale]KAI5220596.1 hypothetical protein E4T40_05845 [Aureobasidium subglaciale]KAI5224196.1 hypothetical protein E4T41_05775 [Aureobasidium subglaciale]KAI5260731.1 hypothetical protein E4T46_05750 [Aureobasidium subglaciale]KEQ95797.1 hypothetical protein AUEXF2481DRAFT_29216 [Aureobasidium subglaciale EXF-2481]
MAPSLLEIIPLPQQTPREPSPAEVENGRYQPPPSRRWYNLIFETIGPMTLRNRQPQSRYPLISGRPRTSTTAKRKQEYVVTETVLPDSGPEELPAKQLPTMAFVKLACVLIPMTVLSLLGIMHIASFFLNGHALLLESDFDFLPDWGNPGKVGEGLAHYPTDATRDVMPIPVHSHNDYWRRIPLYDALHYGCTGVEADVWHIEDELFVGHSTSALTPNRTFKNLYVDPLISLLDKQNPLTPFGNTKNHGVYDEDPDQTLVLLVDLKTDGPSTFRKVQEQLEGLRSKGYLTHFNGTHTVPGAITVVGTGNTPFDLLTANTTYRDIFYDAPLSMLWEPSPISLSDINIDSELRGLTEIEDYHPSTAGQGKTGLPADTPASAFNTSTSYYASINFKKSVGRIWRGKLSHKQMKIIRGQIRGAKKAGLQARYWNTPKWPVSLRNHVWHVLVQEGVGMLNADDLKGAATEDWRRWRREWYV